MVAAVDLIDDLDRARDPVEPDRATVPGRRPELQVAVMLGGPPGDLPGVGDLDLPAVRMTQPQEGPAFAGLVLPAQFDRVVRDSGAEI